MRFNPWEILKYKEFNTQSDEYINGLWFGFKANDFLFTNIIRSNFTQIFIVPSIYFKLEKKLLPYSMPILHLIPNDFEEYAKFPCVYKTWRTDKVSIYHDILNRGFIYSSNFHDYIKKDYESCNN